MLLNFVVTALILAAGLFIQADAKGQIKKGKYMNSLVLYFFAAACFTLAAVKLVKLAGLVH